MTALLDSSVLTAALLPDETEHAASAAVLAPTGNVVYLHALNETFATMTGGRMRGRVDAEFAAQLIRDRIVAHVEVIALDAAETVEAHRQARARGVRGGAIYDYLHLVAARKANAAVLYTLNFSDFLQLRREGDPEVRRP